MSNYQYSSTNVGSHETPTIAKPPARYADLSFGGVPAATECWDAGKHDLGR